jgi:hypothetical protein
MTNILKFERKKNPKETHSSYRFVHAERNVWGGQALVANAYGSITPV